MVFPTLVNGTIILPILQTPNSFIILDFIFTLTYNKSYKLY